MSFELNDEKATDVLIWWIESADGSIDYREEEAVERILANMDYSLETFYQETLMHINGIGTDHIKELVKHSVEWGRTHFDKDRKELTMALLTTVAACDGDITGDQQKKLDAIKAEFGV